MPIKSIKLTPTVDTEQTPTLNEAGIVESSNIRFFNGLPQKEGGFQKFFALPFSGTPRELHGWQGIVNDPHLAVGTTSTVSVLSSGLLRDITPLTVTTTPAVSLSTTNGSPDVTITDTGTNASVYDVVYFNTPLSIGGICLIGAYQVTTAIDADHYKVTAANNATSTVAGGGAVSSFATINGTSTVTVTLNTHGLSVGQTIYYGVATTANGVTISGAYTVLTVPSANTFTIAAGQQATATSSFSDNGGNASIVHYPGLGPTTSLGGYSSGGYSSGGYSLGVAPSSPTGSPLMASDWSFDNFGETLVGCPQNGPVFYWSPLAASQTMLAIPEAPIKNRGLFVSIAQQQVVTYGASVQGYQDPLQVAWCDVSNYRLWRAAQGNQAGTYHIPTGSLVVGGMQGPGVNLIWTDIDLYSMQYIGYPLVYSFNQIAKGCGLIGKKAACMLGNAVYWMSRNTFFVMSGGNVQPLPCTVWDFVFQNLDRSYVDNIRAAANSTFSEVTWYFTSTAGSGVNDAYVKLNTTTGSWDYGFRARTAWIDQSVLGGPIGAAPTGYVYQHETTNDADGAIIACSLKSGYFMLDEGNQAVFVDRCWPDFKWGTYGTTGAALQLTFYYRDQPNGPEKTCGPFTVNASTTMIHPRFRGRQVAVKIAGADLGSFWRMGNLRVRMAADGKIT